MNTQNSQLHLTLNGKVVVSFWISSTKDGGFCFGPSIEDSDLHLTVWQGQGKFRYHVRHKGIKEPVDGSPIGGQKSTKMVLEKIQNMLMKRLRRYHGNKTCWTFTSSRWKKIQFVLPSVDMKGDLYVPLEFVFAELDMDFSKRRLWRKIKIRSLLATEPYFGFSETKRGLRLIKPISKNDLLAWPLSKADEIRECFFRVLGFDDFVEYFGQTDEGKEFWSRAEDRIKQLMGS